MARIGFVMLPGYGHLFPSLTLARVLEARGHNIIFYSTSAASARIKGSGVAFVEVPGTPGPDVHSGFARYRSILRNFRGMIDVTVDWLPVRIRRDRMELLVIDQSVMSGRTLGEVIGIPYVTLCTGLHLRRDDRGRLPPFFTSWPVVPGWTRRLRNRLALRSFDAATAPLLGYLNSRRRAMGLPRHRRFDDTFSDLACLSVLPPELEPAFVEDGRPFRFVGPLVDSIEREASERPETENLGLDRFAAHPLLYVSFGLDGWAPRRLYQSVVEGSAGLGFARLFSTGRNAVSEDLRRFEGADTVFAPVVPQLTALRHASIVVTHGGMNTVLESLLYARPMLIVPLRDDQPGIAARVVGAGAGLMIHPRRVTPDAIRTALVRLRDEGHFRERAQALARACRDAGGARRAADIVEDVLATSALSADRTSNWAGPRRH